MSNEQVPGLPAHRDSFLAHLLAQPNPLLDRIELEKCKRGRDQRTKSELEMFWTQVNGPCAQKRTRSQIAAAAAAAAALMMATMVISFHGSRVVDPPLEIAEVAIADRDNERGGIRDMTPVRVFGMTTVVEPEVFLVEDSKPWRRAQGKKVMGYFTLYSKDPTRRDVVVDLTRLIAQLRAQAPKWGRPDLWEGSLEFRLRGEARKAGDMNRFLKGAELELAFYTSALQKNIADIQPDDDINAYCWNNNAYPLMDLGRIDEAYASAVQGLTEFQQLLANHSYDSPKTLGARKLDVANALDTVQDVLQEKRKRNTISRDDSVIFQDIQKRLRSDNQDCKVRALLRDGAPFQLYSET